MSSRPNDKDEKPSEVDGIDAFDARVRSRAEDTRRFVVLLVLIGVVLSFFFGYFLHLTSAAIDVDLRLAADAYARPGDRVLVDAEVLDPRTGNVRYASGVSLEVWRDGVREDRWKIQGAERREIRMGAAPVELRLSHVSDGPIQSTVHVVVEPGEPIVDDGARARRGGVDSPPGRPGFRRVRTRDACDWRTDAVAYGGVPVASIRTPAMFRVITAGGDPVRDMELTIEGAGGETHRVRTDQDGIAVAGLRIDELAYVEVTAHCAAGEHYTGFEAQPAYDGLAVTKIDSGDDGLRATLEDITQRREARYDLRCDGTLRAFGTVPRSGAINVSEERMGAVPNGTSCVLQVYRAVFATHASYTARPFQWAEASRQWDWRQQADGVTLIGLSTYARSLNVDDAAIEAWRERGYQRIRVGIAAVLGLSMFLWFVFVRWELGVRRHALADGGFSDTGASLATFERQMRSVLWSGWVAIVVSLGSLYVVLWLMGL